MTLQERITILRKLNRLTQEELGVKLNITKSTICKYESGANTPSYTVLWSLADLFNVSIDYLVGRSDDREIEIKTKIKGIENNSQVIDRLYQRYTMIDNKIETDLVVAKSDADAREKISIMKSSQDINTQIVELKEIDGYKVVMVKN